jgi:GntP family gluconate:H+ symporter
LLLLGIPLVAGLSVSHTLVPPHPGAMLAITQLGADTGKTILWSIIVGVPTALIAGPLFGSIISRFVHAELGGLAANLATPARRAKPPSFAMALATILLPVALMLAATLATITLDAKNPIRLWTDFIGSPAVAMLVAVLFSFFSFGSRCGFDRKEILRFTEESVAPAASIILVVGAGGGFSKVLDASEVDQAIVALVSGRNISLLLLGWTLAALIRVAVGSATVAISLAASLMAQMLKTNPAVDRELLVVAVGAGSLILSHVNDGGFWFVKEYFNMSVAQTFKTWTIMETIASVTALLLVLALDALM